MRIPFLRTIDSYLLWQYLTSFGLSVFVLSVLLVLGNIFRRLLEVMVSHDVPAEVIVRFMAFVLPFSLTFTIPWALLTGSLLVFGRLSADNELVALRSLGVSLTRLFVPILAFATLMAGICLWINLDVAPRAEAKMKQTLFEIATNNPLSLFGNDLVITDFPGKVIYVQRRDGDDLYNVQVFDMDDSHLPMQVIIAQRGQLERDTENQRVLMNLFDAQFQQRDVNDPSAERKIKHGIRMSGTTMAIPLNELFDDNQIRLGLSAMTIPELTAELKDRKIAETHGIERKEDGAMAVLFEIQKRYSISVAAIALALIGVPLALTAHRKETSIGFVISLIVAFIYFLLLITVEMFKHDPHLFPHLLIWVPNVLFIGLGIWLFRRRIHA